MNHFTYDLTATQPVTLGLVVLQSDETIEGDFRAMFGADTRLHITRVASAPEVTPETLAAMAAHLTGAAALLPDASEFAAIGYGCTSGTAQIGAGEIARLVQAGARTPHVTNPLSALVAACAALKVTRLAFLSPYVADVSQRLRDAVAAQGVTSPVFGSFNEPSEAKVVRIDPQSTLRAACDLAAQGGIDAIFLSCTNLPTLSVIEEIEAQTGLPCLSSNQVMGWHMAQLSGASVHIPGRLGIDGRAAGT